MMQINEWASLRVSDLGSVWARTSANGMGDESPSQWRETVSTNAQSPVGSLIAGLMPYRWPRSWCWRPGLYSRPWPLPSAVTRGGHETRCRGTVLCCSAGQRKDGFADISTNEQLTSAEFGKRLPLISPRMTTFSVTVSPGSTLSTNSKASLVREPSTSTRNSTM